MKKVLKHFISNNFQGRSKAVFLEYVLPIKKAKKGCLD